MTMKIRITNESVGSPNLARVNVIDDFDGPPVVAESFDLRVGDSREVWIHSTRSVTVEEVQAPVVVPF